MWWLRRLHRKPNHIVAVESPIGASLIRTPARQAIWAQMRADWISNPTGTLGARLYGWAKTKADAPVRTYYPETGLFAAWMFQVTGDAAYAEKAYTTLDTVGGANGRFLTMTGASLQGNYIREFGIEHTIIYDWIYDGISQAHRNTFLATLNAQMLGSRTDAALRVDSDQSIGNFLAIAVLYYATRSHNPSAEQLLALLTTHGGLTATGSNYATTLRNTLKYYADHLIAGGEWCESSEYNTGTPQLMVLGVEGLRSLTGVEAFPEYTALYQDLATRQVMCCTPDLRDSPQWSDDEHFRQTLGNRTFSYQTLTMMLAGVTQGTAAGQAAQQLVLDLYDRDGAIVGVQAEAWPRALLLFNPYAPASARSTLGNSWFASGQGHLVTHDGWTASDAMFWARMHPEGNDVHHENYVFSDFQLYRRGEWAITHPIAYGSGVKYTLTSADAEGNNCLYSCSFGLVPRGNSPTTAQYDTYRSYRSVRGQVFGSWFTYLVGTMGGQAHPNIGYFNPPPTFLHEWTRTYVYLPGTTKQSDVIVICDRSNADDPTTLEKFSRYPASEQAIITAQIAPTQWIMHMPVAPTIGGASASHAQTFPSNSGMLAWTTAGGQVCQVETLWPAVQTKTVYDEATLFTFSGSLWDASEKRWQVRIYPTTPTKWTVFVNVVSARNSGTAVSSTLLTTTDGHGVLVTRTGEPDTVVLFHTAQGADVPAYNAPTGLAEILDTVRLRSTGYTVGWTPTTATAHVLLCDLDPSRTWATALNGGSSTPLSVVSSGVGALTVTTAGAQSLVVTGS